jgi:BlaI family transcriptional regulator, penicillinase repressor
VDTAMLDQRQLRTLADQVAKAKTKIETKTETKAETKTEAKGRRR